MATNALCAGAEFTGFREVLHYDNMMLSFSQTTQYDAAGTVFVCEVLTDPVVDNVKLTTPIDCTFGPNPAQEFVRIQANLDNALVRILGLDGKVVLQERRNDLVIGSEFNLDLDNGIYLLEVTNGINRMTQRLVIQK